MKSRFGAPALPQPSILTRLAPGIGLIVTAATTALVYQMFPFFGNAWSPSGQMLFWCLEGVILAVGVIRVIVALLPERHRLQISSLRRNRVYIPKEGLVYLVIMIVLFVGSLLGHTNMLMLVFAMLAGPFVINGWATFAMLKGSQITRAVPRRAMCGELFAVEVTLKNLRGWMSLWMMQVYDTVTGSGEQLEPSNLFTSVPPGGRQTGHYTLRLCHRGVYEFGPLRLASRFPLGLIERSQMFPLPDRVLIYPRVGRLTQTAQRQLLGAAELSSDRRARSGVYHDEFHHLREYRSGDNPRAIHWRTSARRGALILREYEQNRDQHLALILDLWQPAAGTTAEDRERTEWALCLAATVCLEQRRRARDSRLSLFGDGRASIAWEGRATSASLETLLDQLAVIQAGPAEKTGDLLDQAWHTSSVHTRFIVISTRTSHQDRWEREMVDRLPAGAMQKIQWLYVDPAAMDGLVLLEDG
jgi:uncharacterized protein (DUF58 family)